jgi:hypothetical protein
VLTSGRRAHAETLLEIRHAGIEVRHDIHQVIETAQHAVAVSRVHDTHRNRKGPDEESRAHGL